jgi:hypothetical protein
MFEMTNKDFARLLKGLTIAVGNRKNRVPDELVPRFAFSGSTEAIAAQTAALARLGVDELILAIPCAPGVASRDQVMRQLGPALLKGSAAGASVQAG